MPDIDRGESLSRTTPLLIAENSPRRQIRWVREEIDMGKLSPQAFQILEAVLYRGEISRGEMSTILNVTERHSRRLTSELVERGVLISDSPRAPLRLGFPASIAEQWMPGLFPAL